MSPLLPSQPEERLRAAFLAGAITDALALVPMLMPPVASMMWGFEQPSGGYYFAMGYGASLMLGWTLLLLWAYQSPVERRGVALLTLVVIAGLVVTEVVAVAAGHLAAARLIPTWIIQAGLAYLFTTAYSRSG